MQRRNVPAEESQLGHAHAVADSGHSEHIWAAVEEANENRVNEILQQHPECAAQIDPHTGRTLLHVAAAAEPTDVGTHADLCLKGIMQSLTQQGPPVDVHAVDATGACVLDLLLQQQDADSMVHRFVWLAGALNHSSPLHLAASVVTPRSEADQCLRIILDILVNDMEYSTGATDGSGRTAMQVLQQPGRGGDGDIIAARLSFLTEEAHSDPGAGPGGLAEP